MREATKYDMSFQNIGSKLTKITSKTGVKVRITFAGLVSLASPLMTPTTQNQYLGSQAKR